MMLPACYRAGRRLLPLHWGALTTNGAVEQRCFASAGSLQQPQHQEAAADLQDQIQLQGLQFFGRHGVFEEEQVLGQRFVVNATLWVDLRRAGVSDNLGDTINYAEAYNTIKGIIEGPPFQLLEAAAEAVSSGLLAHDGRIGAVRVQLLKPHVAVPGVVDALGVQIYRRRPL